MPVWSKVILWICPGVIGAAWVGAFAVLDGFRRSWGTSSSPAAVVFGMVLMVVHAGYVLAPVLVSAGRRGWAIGLTAPLALAALVCVPIVVRVLRSESSEGLNALVMIMAGVLMAAYLTPPLVAATIGR